MILEMSTTAIATALTQIEQERRRAERNALAKTLALGAGALLLGILFAILQGWRFSRAIRHLTQIAGEVGRGNLQAKAKPTTNDEIGVLCERFNDMTGRIETLLVENMAKAVLDKELERATAIQAQLMPPRDVFDFEGLCYCGVCESATQVGGDWWHHYQLGPGRVLLCIGDVTGHGIPSAMLTASAKACCDTVIRNDPEFRLSRFMSLLDYTIREAGKGELVMTFFAGLFDTRKMVVEYANAGHNFPLLVRQGSMIYLKARGCRLGDGGEFESEKTELLPGDLVAFYTDGIIECEDPARTEYGMKRFRHRLLQPLKSMGVDAIRDNIMADAFAFYADMPRQDDVTLVVARVSGSAAT